ncbi:MAG: hypothetical protein HY291_18550 [Planctomycetes bacterium]|nr:hypothetical protein [Planctomycetota bacterium]
MAKARALVYPALSADANFPGGNGVEFDRAGVDLLRFKMVKHGSPFCLWWHFRAQVPAGRRVTFELANTADTLGAPRTWRSVRPVFSYDGIRYRRLPKRDCAFDEESRVFRFSGVFAKPVVYLAQAYPYHFAELERLRADLRKSALFRERFAGTSEGGLPFPLWEIGRKAAGRRAPIGIFLCGRHHAGETHGSWALEGMLREIVFGRSPQASWLRAHAHVLVAPFVDIDGVWQGMYGKDRIPIDFNRDWSVAPVRPEVRMLQREVERWAQRVRYAAHFDFHCPCLPHFNHMHSAVPGLATAKLKAAEKDYARELARHSPKGSKFYLKDLVFPGYQGPTGEVTCSSYQRHIYGVLSLTPEIAYHPTRSGPHVKLAALLRYGAAHAKALAPILKEHERGIRALARPFYAPAAAPPAAPAVKDKQSRFAWWSNLGGRPERYAVRKIKDGPGGAQEALAIESDPRQSSFMLTPLTGLKTSSGATRFWTRAEGVRPPKRGARARGLVIHVFYYDRKGRRFGELNGSAVYEMPLEGVKGWRRFAAKAAAPKGAVFARLGIRSELTRGRVLIVP